MKRIKPTGILIPLFFAFFAVLGAPISAVSQPLPTPTPTLTPTGALPINGVTVKVMHPGTQSGSNASHVEAPPFFKKK